MTEPSMQPIRLDFGNLPLIEAAVRASFATPVPLTFEAISQAHSQLRTDFPQIAQPSQIDVPPGIKSEIDLRPGVIQGVVYTGNSSGLVINVQSQLVVVRWLKQVTAEAPDYPRFKALRDTLWHARRVHFEGGQTQSVPIVVNMSYVNFIQVTDAGSVLEDYLSPRVQVAATKNAQQVHKVEVSWQERDSVDLRFSLEQIAADVGGETLDGYRLTTAAGLRLAESNDPRAALEDIHDRLQYFFRDLISDRARDEWQLKES